MPNIVHYVLFTKHEIQFVHFVSILSVLRNQRPDAVYVHCDCHELRGGYTDRVLALMNATNTTFIVRHIERPTEIFGQKLREEWINWHGGDLTRIRTLIEFGGIYLDSDSYITKPLNDFFRYEFTLDFEVPFEGMCPAICMATNIYSIRVYLNT